MMRSGCQLVAPQLCWVRCVGTVTHRELWVDRVRLTVRDGHTRDHKGCVCQPDRLSQLLVCIMRVTPGCSSGSSSSNSNSTVHIHTIRSERDFT